MQHFAHNPRRIRALFAQIKNPETCIVTAFLGNFRAFAHFLEGYMILCTKDGKIRKQVSLSGNLFSLIHCLLNYALFSTDLTVPYNNKSERAFFLRIF